MGAVEILRAVISNLPLVEIASAGVNTDSTGGFLYDVAQAALALKLIATGFDKLARATPWTWDDGVARGFLAAITRGTAWITSLTSTPTKKKLS